MNTMKKILAFAMVVSMVLGCLVFSTAAAEKADYVTDGLVAWYDASNNYNGTQNQTADLWKDLSGNANHIDLSQAVSKGQISWSDKALVIAETGTYLRLPNAVVEALEGNAYTIEIVTGNLEYTASSYITLLSSSNDELSVFIRVHEEFSPSIPNNDKQFKLEYKNQDANGDSNRPYLYNAWEQFNGKTLTVTSDLTAFDGTRDMEANPDQPGNVHMYSNATQIGKGESQYNMSLGGYVYFGHTSEARAWSGEIYGLRIYNRALTEAEVTANAQADHTNYRTDTVFAPTEEYDPALDANYDGFKPLTGMKNDIIPFNEATDLIPLDGFYGSENLFDYLYPLESDDVQWEGARLMKTEEPETGLDGSVFSSTNFVVMYSSYCDRAGLDPLPATKVNYIVVKLIVEGEFEDFNMTSVGYDADTQAEIDFGTGSIYGGIDPDLDGEVQYLVYDVEDIFEDCEYLTKFKFTLNGMDNETEIYLLEIGLFQTEEQAEAYQNGEEIPEPPAEDETEPDEDEDETTAKVEDETTAKVEDDTTAKVEDATTAAPDGDATTAAPTTEEGCKSVVGFGAAAVLVAAAAAVVLKKKD